MASWIPFLRPLALGLATSLFAQGVALAGEGTTPPHIVVILGDDVGVDMVGAYGEHPTAAPTPNLDLMAQQGMLFRRAYANPGCSPSRAALLTGKYAWRNGVGDNVIPDGSHGMLPGYERTIPLALGPTHRCVALGKWHLSDAASFPEHPFQLGFDSFIGTQGNIGTDSYYAWPLVVEQQAPVTETTYSTAFLTDRALEVMTAAQEPTFLYLSYHAIHRPWEAPPAGTHTQDLENAIPGDPKPIARAMMESLDFEIGRLVGQLPTNTVVFFLGDNGTPHQVTEPPWNPLHAKGTPYEGGVRVPMLVWGPGIVQGETDALVQITDVISTICDFTGAQAPWALDSYSFAPVLLGLPFVSRPTTYSESFTAPTFLGTPTIWRRAIRGERYKLVHRTGQRAEFYDLLLDPFETTNIVEFGKGLLSPEELQGLLDLVVPFNDLGLFPNL